jgi:phosphopantothenoylcysteine decarboxylase/phosphopantothenate--cysteine ligase
VELQPTTDILASVAREKEHRLVVGFAAETDHVAENARKKLSGKNADLIVANDVTAEGAGFDVDTNIVTLFSRDGRDVALPKMTKAEVAQRILDEIVRLRAVRQNVTEVLTGATDAFKAATEKSST